MYDLNNISLQSGQLLIIVAILMVAMIAMIGLVVDGGGLLLLKRDAQNAVDAAIVAGTYARCTGSDNDQVIRAVRDAAAKQGYTHNVDGVSVTIDPNYTGSTDEMKYIHVSIYTPKTSYFVEIVSGASLGVTADSVGRCELNQHDMTLPVQTAVYATCGINLDSAPGPRVHDGGLWSNGDCQTTCGASPGITLNGDNKKIVGETTIVDGTLTDSGNNPCFKTSPGRSCTTSPSPGPVAISEQIADFPIQVDLDEYRPGGAKGSDFYWGTGNYHHITGDWSASCPASGVYMVEGNATFGDYRCGYGNHLNITVIATGWINNPGTDVWIEPFNDNLDPIVLYADGNYDGTTAIGGSDPPAIYFSQGHVGRTRGLVIAPHGQISIYGPDVEAQGAIYGECVSMVGNDIGITFNDDYLPQEKDPPIMGIAE